MIPIIALAAASFVIALKHRESGVIADSSTPEQSVQVYRQVITFLCTIMEDNLAQERLIMYCHLVITHATLILGEGVADEDNNF